MWKLLATLVTTFAQGPTTLLGTDIYTASFTTQAKCEARLAEIKTALDRTWEITAIAHDLAGGKGATTVTGLCYNSK